MVNGQHHVRMNMYIAQVRDGALQIVKSFGVIDPEAQIVQERSVVTA
jgi:hypothetical protein